MPFTPKEKAAIGIGSGAVLGTGVGLLVQLAHHAAGAEPTGVARAVTTLAWTLIGTGGAGLLWSGAATKIDFHGSGSVSGPEPT